MLSTSARTVEMEREAALKSVTTAIRTAMMAVLRHALWNMAINALEVDHATTLAAQQLPRLVSQTVVLQRAQTAK
jgi:hypothetical protein